MEQGNIKITAEEWRPVAIEGFDKCYLVSNHGNMKSLVRSRCAGIKSKVFKPMAKVKMTNGYYCAGLSVKDKKLFTSIHRVVALTFIPNPSNYPVINHINGIKTDNCVENLEWCTMQYNTQHAFETGLSKGRKNMPSGIKAPAAKRVQCLMTGEVMTMIQAASFIQLSMTNFSRMMNNKMKNWLPFIFYN